MVRAKFRVHSVTTQSSKDKDGNVTVFCKVIQAGPVYSNDENSENHKFWLASPAGTLTLYINNPQAYDQFEEGQEYYLDFTLAN